MACLVCVSCVSSSLSLMCVHVCVLSVSRVQGLDFRVWTLGFLVLGFGFRVLG